MIGVAEVQASLAATISVAIQGIVVSSILASVLIGYLLSKREDKQGNRISRREIEVSIYSIFEFAISVAVIILVIAYPSEIGILKDFAISIIIALCLIAAKTLFDMQEIFSKYEAKNTIQKTENENVRITNKRRLIGGGFALLCLVMFYFLYSFGQNMEAIKANAERLQNELNQVKYKTNLNALTRQIGDIQMQLKIDKMEKEKRK